MTPTPPSASSGAGESARHHVGEVDDPDGKDESDLDGEDEQVDLVDSLGGGSQGHFDEALADHKERQEGESLDDVLFVDGGNCDAAAEPLREDWDDHGEGGEDPCDAMEWCRQEPSGGPQHGRDDEGVSSPSGDASCVHRTTDPKPLIEQGHDEDDGAEGG